MLVRVPCFAKTVTRRCVLSLQHQYLKSRDDSAILVNGTLPLDHVMPIRQGFPSSFPNWEELIWAKGLVMEGLNCDCRPSMNGCSWCEGDHLGPVELMTDALDHLVMTRCPAK